jgi:O-antigen ligase
LTDKLVGLFANDIGELLAFTFWAALCLAPLLRNRPLRWAWLATAGLVLLPFLALKSRAGFLALSAAALMLAIVRWRRLLLIFPVAAALTLALVPSVAQRVTEGLSGAEVDWNTVSAGRLTNIWPPVLAQIMRSPLLGHGRYGILREQCAAEILEAERTLPTHPHNAYLEALLDTGVVGLALCLTWLALLAAAGRALIRAGGDPLGPATGSVALVAVAAEVSAAIAGSSFFPSQSTVPALVAWGVTLRLYAERRAWQARQVFRPHRRRPARQLQGVP